MCGCTEGTHLPGDELFEQEDLSRGVGALLARLDKLLYQLARGQPASRIEVQLFHELPAGKGRGDVELLVKDGIGGGFVPLRVEAAHAGREIGTVAVLGLDVLGVLGYPVVDGVNGFDEVAVEEGVDIGNVGVLVGDAEFLGDDFVAKVPYRWRSENARAEVCRKTHL
jgi:hypothetical protein